MSLEFVYASEGCEECVALCANPAVIEDRIDRSRPRSQNEVPSIRLNCKYRIYASFEILLLNSADPNVVPNAIFVLCRHFTYDQLIEVIELFVQSGVEIHHASTGSASVSFLCRYGFDNVINLIQTLVQHDCISSRICDALVQLCRNGVGDLIQIIRTLINHDIENVRIDCDSVNGNIAEDVKTILLRLDGDAINSRTEKCQLKSVFKSCRATVHVKIHSPLHQRTIYNHQVDHVDESGLLRFNTRENSILLPAFRDWQTIHGAWHCTDVVAGQLDRLIFSYLDKHSHRRELCDKSAGVCDWCRVGSEVDDYLNRLMDKVEEMCSLFAAERLIHYGSSAEKTNIFRASEFDRGVVLNNFGQSPSDSNQIVYTGNDPAYVALKDGEYPINSSSLLVLFMKSITDAVERVHSVHVFAPTVAFGETCVTVYFLYRGRHPSAAVKVSVDITIAVKAAEQPAMISNGWFVSDDVEGVVLLVPHRRGVGSQWRLSYPTLERDMLLHAGEQVSRVYQLLKFLAALHHAKDNLKREIPRKSSLSSYALKTCLFRYMRHHYRPPPWQPEDALRHAVGILRQFPIHSCEMTSYFNKEIVVFNVTPKSRKAVAEIISVLNKLL